MAFNSNAPALIPLAAPEPASPIKCSLPILLANNDAPTWFKFEQLKIHLDKRSCMNETHKNPGHFSAGQTVRVDRVAFIANQALLNWSILNFSINPKVFAIQTYIDTGACNE